MDSSVPTGLGEAGSRAWADMAPRLGQKLDSEAERAALLAFCTAVDRQADARRRIANEGELIADARGNPVPHPALALEKSASAEIRAWLKRYRPETKTDETGGDDWDEPCSIAEAARAAGISAARYRQLRGEGRMPHWPKGELTRRAFVDAYHAAVGERPGKSEQSEDTKTSRARWELARAEKLEIANAEKRGRLLDRDAVLLAASRVAGVIRDALEALPVRVAPDDFELRSRLEREVHDVLTHLSSLDPEEVTR